MIERAGLDAQLFQVRPGPADKRAGRDTKDRHDLVAVQVRPDPVQFFCAASPLMRASRSPWAAASRSAFALFRVV